MLTSAGAHGGYGIFSHSVGGMHASQCVARHLPNPAIPPYSIQTPHCMEPRRWRIHSSAGRRALREVKVLWSKARVVQQYIPIIERWHKTNGLSVKKSILMIYTDIMKSPKMNNTRKRTRVCFNNRKVTHPKRTFGQKGYPYDLHRYAEMAYDEQRTDRT